TATFSWSAGTSAQGYFLYVGTSAGANNIFGNTVSGQSATISNIPTNGSTIYVRLWTLLSGAWQYNDYTYRAATVTTTPPPPTGGSSTPVVSPASGTALHGTSVAFSWSPVTNAAEYFFYAGTTPGANNLYGQSTGLNRTATVTNLPVNGQTVYVRVWWRVNGN